MIKAYSLAALVLASCGGSSTDPSPDAPPPIVPISAAATHDWALGGGGQPTGGGAGRDSLSGLRFAASNTRGWIIWDQSGQVVNFADLEIQASVVQLDGGVPALKFVDTGNQLWQIGLGLATVAFSEGVLDLDVVRSIDGFDNFTYAVGSKAGVPRLAAPTAVPLPGLTSDRYFAEPPGCLARDLYALSPQRADAGKAVAVRGNGTTVFAATEDGAASCNGDRLIMDGTLFSLSLDGRPPRGDRRHRAPGLAGRRAQPAVRHRHPGHPGPATRPAPPHPRRMGRRRSPRDRLGPRLRRALHGDGHALTSCPVVQGHATVPAQRLATGTVISICAIVIGLSQVSAVPPATNVRAMTCATDSRVVHTVTRRSSVKFARLGPSSP